MVIYCVYSRDTKTESIQIIKSYKSRESARNNMLSHALEIVKENGGTNQLKIAVQKDNTPNDIKKLGIDKFPHGYYVWEDEEKEIIRLYEKYDASGYLITSYDIRELYVFGIIEANYNTDITNPIKIKKSCTKKTHSFPKEIKKSRSLELNNTANETKRYGSMLDELNALLKAKNNMQEKGSLVKPSFIISGNKKNIKRKIKKAKSEDNVSLNNSKEQNTKEQNTSKSNKNIINVYKVGDKYFDLKGNEIDCQEDQVERKVKVIEDYVESNSY